jgi:hypothetical protein
MITPRRREYITVDANDPAAYDERGILKDGYKIRVPIAMMDSRLPIERMRSAPLSITTGLRMDRFYNVDGTLKEPRTPRTRNQPVVDVDQYSDHKPGFRVGDAGAGRATVDAKVESYNQLVSDLELAWMAPWQKAQHISDAATADACPAGVDPRDFAYHQRCLQDSEAWRTPPPVLDAAAVTTPPANAYAPVGYGANAGDVCSSNGAPGNLVERDGWLFCEVHQPGPTRSGTSSASGRDTAVGDRSAQDSAWRAMVAEQSEAWRKQG